ncbi:DNA topoisomerase [Johnsonella ignava]|uniref:DNA topoisomerase n=1 Tax=Johnsonella ignava TaxID=43995 RepID=UPI0023F4EAE6|nr:DNA topoisomerase [Johnsonella ignava]
MKNLYIAEKPSVAQEFAKALKIKASRKKGCIESQDSIVTWCVGHLVTMSYPEKYDPIYKRWSLNTLPFLPKVFKYEVIENVKEQFDIVSTLLNRADVSTIYICTDSGREGEYIYRLVDETANVAGKKRKRVWIDSQTEEEILRGISEAKDWSEYDNLSSSAYLRAKEDYLMGINFSRLLTLKYGNTIAGFLKKDRAVLSVGRVMTCVIGMVIRREREIRDFLKIPFYKVIAVLSKEEFNFPAEWRVDADSAYFDSPLLYKENGFKKKEDAQKLIDSIIPANMQVFKSEKKKEIKNPPLLYNLAEIQNECSKKFKISPDETLKAVQSMYEKKLVTYPRTDARVLSSAAAKEIHKNITGLKGIDLYKDFAQEIIASGKYKNIEKTKYVNDSRINDHYAIIPTGQTGAYNTLSPIGKKIYDLICRRFLAIFYSSALYERYNLEFIANAKKNTDLKSPVLTCEDLKKEHFVSSFKLLKSEGYLKLYNSNTDTPANSDSGLGKDFVSDKKSDINIEDDIDKNIQKLIEIPAFRQMISKLKNGDIVNIGGFDIKEGETSPPKRYTSGSMILAMENAGQLIEDEELRSLIKGSGIGTSATRAEILKKLFTIKYLTLNNKTQVITPTLLGELVYEAVNASISHLLNPELTASWEKGLNCVSQGTITSDEYMEKLENFVSVRTANVIRLNNQYVLKQAYDRIAGFYKS